MAGKALPGARKESDVAPRVRPDRKLVQEAAAKLYGQGYERRVIARMLVDHIVPNGLHRPVEVRVRQANVMLRRWEHQQDFRDMVYTSAVVKLDMATPGILKGVANKAKRGRVDAARLALELTGRHNPKGDQQPAQVAVIIGGVPRPRAITTEPDGQVIIEANEAMIAEDQDV